MEILRRLAVLIVGLASILAFGAPRIATGRDPFRRIPPSASYYMAPEESPGEDKHRELISAESKSFQFLVMPFSSIALDEGWRPVDPELDSKIWFHLSNGIALYSCGRWTESRQEFEEGLLYKPPSELLKTFVTVIGEDVITRMSTSGDKHLADIGLRVLECSKPGTRCRFQ